MLDPGDDDYYLTGRAAVPGIEPFWTKMSPIGSLRPAVNEALRALER
jgi:hypothetical protein